MVVVTVWSAACLIPYSFLNSTEIIRPETYAQQINEMHQKLQGQQLVSVNSSVVQSCPTLCNSMDCSTPGLPVHRQLLEFTQAHVHWVCDAIQPSHPLSSPSPPTLNLPQHQGLFKWSQLFTSVAEVLGVSASTSVLPMNTQDWFPLGWMDWLDLLAVQGTLKSLLQHHSSKASILQCSAFFIVQHSHPYMTT